MQIVEKFVRRKEGITESVAFIDEDASLAHGHIHERPDPAALRFVECLRRRSHRLFDRAPDDPLPFLGERLAQLKRFGHRAAPGAKLLGELQGGIPSLKCFTFLIAPLVKFRLPHPGDEIAAVDVQRPFQGFELGLVVAGSAVRGSEIAQQCSRMRIGGDRPFESFRRSAEIALAQGVHALAVGGSGLLDRLRHLGCLPAGGADGKVGKMTKSAADIVADPEWLAHRYDEKADAFQYRHVTRSRHAEVGFATDDYLGKEENPVVIRREQAAGYLGKQAPIHFIFHSAYCASTMLVRALDVPGSAMGISEPVILNDMVGWRIRGAEVQMQAQVMDNSLGQLSRPWGPGEAVVVKPSNIFNSLAMGALSLRPNAKALLLHAPLDEFLLSVARKGMWCRLWVRELLEMLLRQGMVDLGFEPRDYLRHTDLQAAAVGWLAQQMQFHRIAGQFGPDRVASIDSETLTADPAGSVAKVATFLELKSRDAADYAKHPAIGRNSKSGAGFERGERQLDQARAREVYGDEIDKVAEWARVVGERRGVSLELPFPLA